MRVLDDILRLGAKRHGERTAICLSDHRLSYSELDEAAEKVARGLCGLGVKPGDRVAILSTNSLCYPIIAFGVFKSGATLLPINFRYQAQELAYVLNDACPAVLFVESSFAVLAEKARESLEVPIETVEIPGPAEGVDWIWPNADGENSGSGKTPPVLPDPEGKDPTDPATLMYTSGTTGKPKGVLFPHSGYFATFHALLLEGDIQPGEVTLVNLPLFHQAALFAMILPTWMRGGTVVLTSGHFDPLEVLRDVEKHHVTLTMWVPTMLARLLEVPNLSDFDLSSLRKIYYGSAPMNPTLYKGVKAAFKSNFYQWYGLTETGLNTVLRPEDHQSRGQCTGREVYNCEIRISDEGREVEVGQVGEIFISGANHGMIGYLNRPKEISRGAKNTGFSRLLRVQRI